MILQRMSQAIKRQDWFQVTIEILIVVIGIFLGLQVTDWAEQREDRVRELLYLDRINEELGQDILSIQRGIDNLLAGRERGEFLSQTVGQPELVSERPTYFVSAVLSASFTNSPAITSDTYEELKFSGDLPIILNKTILSNLTNYYGTIERDSQELTGGRSGKDRYDEERLGILTPNQFRQLMKVGSPRFGEIVFSEEEAKLAYERMIERPEFIEQIAVGSNHGRPIRLYTNWLNSAKELRKNISAELELKL